LSRASAGFCEQKEAKNFVLRDVVEASPKPIITRSFLLLFFKKEALTFC
jgi:hypothetical protein